LENSATKDKSAMIDINPAQTSLSFSLKGNLADRLFTCVFDEKGFFSGVIAWVRVHLLSRKELLLITDGWAA